MKQKLVLSVTLLLTFSLHAQAQNTPDRPLITVTGQAEILVVPDEVVFNLNATTVDKDLAVAQRKTDEVVRNVLALARRYEIPATKVQTGHIRLEERYSNEALTRQPPVFLGYAVSKSIAIILRDVSKAETLLGEIFKSGITQINSVDFRTTQSRKLKDQARAMAIKAAQEKASALAKEIGQTIGKAHTISESDTPFRHSGTLSNYIGESGGGTDEDVSTIALGQISITARVVVSFDLK